MLLLILYIYHFFAVPALPDVATAVGFVEVDAIDRERFVAVGAFLRLGLSFQLSFVDCSDLVIKYYAVISIE